MSVFWRAATIASFILLAGVAPAVAQQPAGPPLTPADSGAVLLDMAGRFSAGGQRELAEAIYRYLIDHYSGTTVALEAKQRLTVATATRSERGGRTELITWGTMYGTWLGLAIPAVFGANESGAYGAGLLIGAPAGFLLPKAILGRGPLTAGQARAISFGSLWGTLQGLGWRSILHLGDHTINNCFPDVNGQTQCYQYHDTPSEAPFAAAILGGVSGIAAGALLARSQARIGTVSAAQFGALWGGWFGFVAGAAVDAEEKPLLASTLVGSNVGLIATALIASKGNVSPGRPWLITAAGVAGLVGGLGLDLLFEVDDEQTAILLPAAGSIAGLVAGVAWTSRSSSTDRPGVDDRDQGRGGGGGGGGLLNFDLRNGRAIGSAPTLQPAAMPRLALDGRLTYRPGVRIPVVAVSF